MNPNRIVFVAWLTLATLLAGCATIGSSTVRLSAEAGDRASEMQSLHLAAVETFFDSERRRIEDFLDDTWEPLFLKNFLGISGILEDLRNPSSFDEQEHRQLEEAIAGYLDDPEEASRAAGALADALSRARQDEPSIVRSVLADFVEDDRLTAAIVHITALLGTDEPAQMIFDFAEDAHREMLAQRRELLEPLDAQRRLVLSELRASWAELTAAQSLITARLAAANRLKGEQDELFDSLLGEGRTEAIRSKLAGISADVGGFLNEAETVIDNRGEVDMSSLVTLLKTNLSN